MTKLLFLLVPILVLSSISQSRTNYCSRHQFHYYLHQDLAYIFLIIILIFFSGLRIEYNDTWNYIDGFNKSPLLSDFLKNPDSYNIFKNPLFFFLQALLKTTVGNPQWLIFLSSAFTQICFILFFKRYSSHFTFTVFLYFTYGTFCFSLAALKQVLAMAVITLAIPFLEKKQWSRYFFLVFIAMLIHTYALIFIVLPLFRRKPWKLFTLLFVAVMIFVMMNFQDVIEEFMEQANELGKTLADYEVFSDNTINTLRLMVYAVVPAISFLFRKRLFQHAPPKQYLLVHMSILSLAFMSMGTQAGANMFARMGTYFELGTLCTLPWMLDQIFDRKSFRLISCIAIVMFSLYFIYSFGINISFDAIYKVGSVWRLFA